MADPTPPAWLFPNIYSTSRMDNRVPPTWHVVFICPMEDTERVEMSINLSTVDEEWADRPQAAVRCLVEIR
ncbi:hypothetical protein N7499_001198 [Penicillium canescens]|uniref:Uncharacterized protein n=1 Tax=Penicillium canescens TaxID=5083 RepID=A0AAD6I2M2_PENCN|nr:uncharacterized protein N7446_003663 [Penicillium canescens]KAJ6008753.1 hypothetical protein N7522_003769 [Penicillium canescens]KAJ6027740.1 hypothetical protein N7460_012557 [Penicillium canescens]KAJ6041020.1 hypothetical protein N7444_009925 [Penicillium canescens]KAJ6066626.1 hypothetical protein N7446_003663 [Penicillium canescens]KAJ6101568.1 hypothetical protein N7499_001198 [Penicillium canescens]